MFYFFLLYIFVIEYEHSTQTEKKNYKRIKRDKRNISDFEPKALVPNDKIRNQLQGE